MAQSDKFERYYGIHLRNYTQSTAGSHYMYRVSSHGSCWYSDWQDSYCEQTFFVDDSDSQSKYDLGAVRSMGRGLFNSPPI
jgi:hypothetical protein